MAVYAFASEDDFKRAVRAIKLSESARLDITRQRGRWPVAGSGGESGMVEGRLISDLVPASNSLTGGSTFSFIQYIDSGSDAMPKVLINDVTLEGVNRSTTLEADAGVYIICGKINGEWRPIWVDSSNVCTE
jgi:hypothetical protein